MLSQKPTVEAPGTSFLRPVKMLRKVMMMRRILHVRGDVMCTLVLLLLLCLLLYCQQLLLSSAWSKPQLKLEIHGSTSSSRTLLGARGARGPREAHKVPSDPQLPHCRPGPDPDPSRPDSRPQTRSTQTRSRSKSKKKKAVGTKTAKAPPLALTTPPFDFEGYLREKDKRTFQLLVDQPKKCDLREEEEEEEEEEGGGGRRSNSEAAAPYLLIAVKSTAGDFDKRQVVRQTWGKEGVFQSGVSIRTVFLLGTPRNRSALPLWDRLLAYESRTFKDVLVWDFEDTFFNLTLKETHFLDWVNSSCPHVRFVFKGDADVYVNVENILEMLRGRDPEEDLFVGDIIVRAKPIRRRNSKYYVPEFLYGGGLYPDYAGGGGFVMSGHTARRLGPACRQVELFPIDDVFLGMCLQLIGVKPSPHQGFRTFGIPRPSAAPHLQTFDPCFYKELMVVHSLSVPQIWLMWNLLRDPKLSCHSRSGPRSGPFRWRTEDDYGDKTVFLRH